MFDEPVFARIVGHVHDGSTLARLACASSLFRELVRNRLHSSGDQAAVFSGAASPAARARAAALLAGDYRRVVAGDGHATQRRGLRLDARPYALDWSNLPVKWLEHTQLLVATEQQSALLYDVHLELLGALSFADPQEAAAQARQQPSMFLGKISMLLFKCPLMYGALFVAPALRHGAAECLGPWRLQQASSAAATAQRPLRPVDDDIHLLRQSLLRPGLLSAWRVLAVPAASLLTGAMVEQVVAGYPSLALRYLDIQDSTGLPDDSLALLLTRCPHLGTLRAGGSSFGPACLKALCGLAAPQGPLRPAAPHQERQRQQHGGSSPMAVDAPAAGGGAAHAASLGVQHRQRNASQPPGHPFQDPQQQQQQGQRHGVPCPCTATLHTLDLSRCTGLSGCGALLPRAVSHLKALRDLRLNGVPGAAGVLFEAAQQLGAAKGSGAAAAAFLGVLGQLTRLELQECGGGGGEGTAAAAAAAAAAASAGAGLGSKRAGGGPAAGRAAGSSSSSRSPDDSLDLHHVDLLAEHCTLRHLALSSQRLAEQQLRQAWRWGSYAPELVLDAAAPSAGDGIEGGQCRSVGSEHQRQQPQQGGGADSQGVHSDSTVQLPGLLTHLDVGWGAGGAFLWRSALSSPYLASLTVHLGAAASDWHLRQLAAACPYLARLELRGANVSDQGLSTVLSACSQLTSLRLYSCAGPVTDALGAALHPRAPAFRLQDLQLSFSNLQITGAGLAALLHPSVAALRCLALRGCGRLADDQLWPAVAQHAATLHVLELEDCGTLPARIKLAALLQQAQPAAGGGAAGVACLRGVPTGDASGPGDAELAASQPAPLSAGAAVDCLAACKRLRAVTVRGSIVWSKEAVARFYAACPGVVTAVLEG